MFYNYRAQKLQSNNTCVHIACKIILSMGNAIFNVVTILVTTEKNNIS